MRFSSLWNQPVGLVFLGSPAFTPTGWEIPVSNATRRAISYRVAEPQIKCDGVWKEVIIVYGFANFMTGQSGSFSPKTLAPEQAGSVTGYQPRNISAPLGATAWRVAAVWHYSSPTKLQEWEGNVLEFVMGRNPYRQLNFHTNFSTEVSMR